MSLISARELTKTYPGVRALDALTLDIEPGIVGFVGANGAGKSTFIRILLGLLAPTSGTATVLGLDTRKDGVEVRRRVGYMPENDSFIADMSGVRFVRYMAELAGLPPNEAMERAHEAFFYVGLGEARYRTLNGYSLGMKQLAKLAQAIAHGPKLLFLDEPTNGLDPPARARMINLIREIRETEDMHIVLSSHLLRDVEECCDEVFSQPNLGVKPRRGALNIQDKFVAKRSGSIP